MPSPRSARKAAVLVIVMMTAATILQGWTSYRAARDDAASLLATSAKVLEYQVDEDLHAFADILADAAERIDPDRWPDQMLLPWIEARVAAFPEINNILVVGLNGRSIDGGVTAGGQIGPSIDASDREYFHYHLNHPTDHSLHIGDPFISRVDDRPVIPLSQAVFNRQGTMTAIVRLAVDPKGFSEGFSAVLAETDASNALLRLNGTYLARAPSGLDYFGKTVATSHLFKDLIPHATEGGGESTSPLDGITRIVAFRALEHYPVIVVAARTRDSVLSRWRSQQYLAFAVLAMVAAALLLMAHRSDRREQQRALLVDSTLDAERRATRTQQQMADAIATLDDAIALFDGSERLITYNDAYVRSFGASHDAIHPGLSFEEILRLAHKETPQQFGGSEFEAWLVARLKRFRQATGERFVVADAKHRWVQSRESRTRDGGVIAVRTDITALKAREEELDRLQHRYQIILDSTEEGIVGLDANGIVIFANRAAATLLAVQASDMVGHSVDAFVRTADGPDVLGSIRPPIAVALRHGVARQHLHGEMVRRADGKEFPIDCIVAPVAGDESVSGAVVMFHDATMRLLFARSAADHQRELERQVTERTADLRREVDERILAEEALRASRERLKRMTDGLHEGVLVVDALGQIAFANPSAKRLLNCNGFNGDIEGYPLDHLLHLRHGDHAIGFEGSPWQRVIVEGLPQRDDDAMFVIAKDKSLAAGYACSPIMDDRNRRSALISFRDVGALKAAQREALQSSRLASVGQLAAGIAHEINTPVQYVGDNLRFVGEVVTELAEVLEAAHVLSASAVAHAATQDAAARFDTAAAAADVTNLVEDAKAAVGESLDGIAQVARIVRSMKEFSHPGSAAKTMNDLNRALENTLTVCRNVWKHVATIEKTFDPSLPPVQCHGGEMNQVFLNLIVNAAHAIEASGKVFPGRITITTSHGGGMAEIRVADSGTGVPDAIKDHIFDPFFTTKEVGKGTGQGLAICRDVVVTKHRGTIDIGGKAGEGAIFIVRIPLEDGASPSTDVGTETNDT